MCGHWSAPDGHENNLNLRIKTGPVTDRVVATVYEYMCDTKPDINRASTPSMIGFVLRLRQYSKRTFSGQTALHRSALTAYQGQLYTRGSRFS